MLLITFLIDSSQHPKFMLYKTHVIKNTSPSIHHYNKKKVKKLYKIVFTQQVKKKVERKNCVIE